MIRGLTVAGFVAALAGTAVARPEITTLFAGGNNNSPGGGAYFTLTVGPNPIQVTGFATNIVAAALGQPLPFRVFTAPNTHVGNEANPAAWTLVGEGTGTGVAINGPNPITMNGSFILAANTSYGIAVTHSSASGAPAPQSLAYTNGNGANQNYANGDLSLALGTTTNVLFAGVPFNPRVWNGTITYNVIPAPASLALLGLGGLVAARRRR